MPNIPLADIPNAPRITPGAPDIGANMGALQNTVSRFVKNSEQQLVPSDFGQSSLKALGGLGDTMEKTALDLYSREAKAKAEYQVADARTAWDAGYDTFTSSIQPGDDPDRIRSAWAEKKKEMLGQVMSNPDLSPAAKQRLQIEAMRFDRVSTVSIDNHARKMTFERAKVSLQDRAESLLNAGDVVGAKNTYRLMGEQKLLYPEQVTALEQAADNKHELLTYGREIDADPKAAKEKLSALMDTEGKTRNTKLSVEQIQKLQDVAARSFNQRKSQLVEEVVQMIDANTLRDKNQIEELGQGYFDPLDVAVLDRKRQKLQPPSWDEWSRIYQRAQTYNAVKDPNKTEYYGILNDIHNLPEGWREKVRSTLNDSQTPNASLRSSYAQKITALAKSTFMGDASTKPDGSPKNPEQYARNWESTAKFHYSLDEFLSQNPRATTEQLNKWFNDTARQFKYVKPDSGKSRFGWNGYDLGVAVSNGTPARGTIQAIDAAVSILRPKQPDHIASYNEIASQGLMVSGSQPLASGTMYGYKWDPYKDSNSLAGIGAFVPRTEQAKIKAGQPSDYQLKEGDVAISPDMEKQFSAKGIKPFDMVKVTFDDGSSTTVRWADRTMQDKQAKEKFGKPLRGRIDFFSPDGNTPFDGKKIISFEKAK